MSKKEEVKVADPLLGGDDEGQDANDEPSTPVKAAVVPKEAESVKEVKTTAQKLKEEAVAMFPNDTAEQTKYILDRSPKVSFLIPQVEGEIGVETVQINEYRLTIQKNVLVDIPVQVANILAEKYKINMTAGADKRIDRTSDVSEALR